MVRSRHEKYMKLDICGGNTKIYKDFLNVDGRSGPQVDIVTDIRKPLPFKDSEVEEILSVATLEHLIIDQANRLIKEFYRILKYGGTLSIGVPDMKKICESYINKTLPHTLLNQYIYGQLFETSIMEFDCHKSIYDFTVLKNMLEVAGFREITEVPYNYPMHRKDLMIKIICQKPYVQ